MRQDSKHSYFFRGMLVLILFSFTAGLAQAANHHLSNSTEAVDVSFNQQPLDPLVTEEPTIIPTEVTPIEIEDPIPETFAWIAPTGIVTDTLGNPAFQWTHIDGVTSYLLFVGRGTLATGLSTVFYEQLATLGYCPTTTCSVILPEVNAAAWVFDGEYTVYIKPANYEWSGPHVFTVDVPQPEAPTILPDTPLVNNKPVLHWNLPGNAAHAAFFQIYIAPAADLAAVAVNTWVTRAEACVDWVGTVCNWIPTETLPDGAYHVYIQGWGAGGFSTGGIGGTGWAGGIFNIGGPTPGVPTAASFNYTVNSAQVTITFPDDANTTSVYFFIGNVGVTPLVINFMAELPDAQLGCDGTTCTFTPTLDIPLTTGTYTVYVQPKSSGGPRGDGIANLGWFEAGTFNAP